MVEIEQEGKGSRSRYTASQVAEALKQTRGIKTLAANALKCNRATIDNYINRYPLVKRAYEEATEIILDVAEGHIIRAVIAGDLEESHWYLKNKGQKRGYGAESQKIELTGKDGGPVEVSARVITLTPETLREAAVLLLKSGAIVDAEGTIVDGEHNGNGHSPA